MTEPDGWEAWSNHVLKELERLNSCYESMRKSHQVMTTEIATLKVKASMWGAIAGTIPGLIIAFMVWLSKQP